MEIKIRKEVESDYATVFSIVEKAFSQQEYSDQTEQFLVERLRKSTAFVPELSLIADHENKIVGHILLTKIDIINDQDHFESLSLAPVSVLPEFQRNGIGGKLIRHAHEAAKSLGYRSVVLIGHEHYYPRFGYQMADTFGITFPFEAPKENCMVKELIEDGLKDVTGMVKYPNAFFE